MKGLTKEEFEFLKPFESRMESATKSDYARPMLRSEMERMKEIYERLTEDKSIHITCGKCVLRMLKGLYKPYLEKRDKKPSKAKENGNNVS